MKAARELRMMHKKLLDHGVQAGLRKEGQEDVDRFEKSRGSRPGRLKEVKEQQEEDGRNLKMGQSWV